MCETPAASKRLASSTVASAGVQSRILTETGTSIAAMTALTELQCQRLAVLRI